LARFDRTKLPDPRDCRTTRCLAVGVLLGGQFSFCGKNPVVAIVFTFVEHSGMATSSHSPAARRSGPPEAGSCDLIPTRESLLSRPKNWEDRQSWQNFFDTHWNLIYGMARKAGLSDAEAQVYLAKHRIGRLLRKEIKTLQKQIC
jgi:hypothetical protein